MNTGVARSLDIYTEHFGLHQRPFSLQPDPDFLYWSPIHKRAYTMLEYGIMTHAPITVITGEVGAGKTTLLRLLLRNLASEFTVGLVSNAHGDRGALLHWVLMALGQSPAPDASHVMLFSQFQSFLVDEYAAGRRTILIFDEAQNLNEETLEELRMFSNINADQDELIQLVLVGQPELREMIRGPNLLQFAQRVSSDFHLSAMSASEVRDYISHRTQIAGSDREIFTEDAARAVHMWTRGVPRLINQLCDYALVYVFSEGGQTVEAPTIHRVVKDRRANGNFALPLKSTRN